MRHVAGHRLAGEPMTAPIGDQAEELLTACGTPEMMEAARNLRLAALSIRRLLMRPLTEGTSLQLGPSVPDLELRRAELADLAVDVVTAADYLMRLLSSPAVTASRLALADQAGPGGNEGNPDEATFDLLTRRQLDARGTAVRLGMRLLSQVNSDLAPAGDRQCNGAGPQAGDRERA